MKKYILLLLLFLPALAFSTHNMAGDITYSHISGYTYQIKIQTYTNTSGTTADRCELMLCFGDGDSAMVPRINGPSSACPTSHDGFMISATIKMNIYSAMHTFPGPGNYILCIVDPTRTASICNISSPASTSFSLNAELVINSFTGGNSGPNYGALPINYYGVGAVAIYNPSAIEIDGDSLFYEIIPPVGSGPGYTAPATSSSFTIDPDSGLVTWDSPVSICTYVYSIKISEFRNISGTFYYMGFTMQEVWNVVGSASAVEENSQTLRLSVFPNPSSDVIRFKLERPVEGEIKIFNTLGSVVRSISFTGNELQVSDLSEGLYSYSFYTSGGIVNTGKFIVLDVSMK
jgi:hypothetical protein